MTNPAPLLAVATGFMAAKQLFAASELGLFAAVEDKPLTCQELAVRTGLPERTARILADAMIGVGLLKLTEGRYANTEVTSAYLAGADGTLDLRPFLAFWDALSYPHWLSYTESMRTAEPAPFDLDEQRMPVFMGGVQTYNSLHALMLSKHYDFSVHQNILDLAGLSTAFLIEAMKQHPVLHGTFISTGIPGSDLERIEFHDADVLTDPIPGSYDAVLLEHVVHRYDADQNRTILRKARAVVEPGGSLLLLDFLLDSSDARRLDPLLAGEYLVIDGTVVYPEDEVRSWLVETGWRWLETRALPGSPRVIIARAE